MLEANPTLQDGNPLFHNDNTFVQGGLNYKTVLSIFRSQKNSVQQLIGYEPRYLIVPSSLELDLLTELELAGLSGEIEIFSRADVTSLYLLSDPNLTPAVVRLALSETPSLSLAVVPGMNRSLCLTGENDFTFSPVSRYGICRLTPV